MVTPPDANFFPVGYQSAHFAIRWQGNTYTQAKAAATAQTLENAWNVYMNKVGFTEPFCDTAEKHKVNVQVDPKIIGVLYGSGTAPRDPAIWASPDGFDWKEGVAHELGHAMQFSTGGVRDSKYVGWMWESHADWMMHQTYPSNVGSSSSLLDEPHLYFGSTRNIYSYWQYWEFLKDKYGYRAVNEIWTKAPKQDDPARIDIDPFAMLAKNMGWSASDLNDSFGEWAMHNVNWDYRNPDGSDQGKVYRKAYYGNTNVPKEDYRLTRLEALDKVNRRYVVPAAKAPQRWGYNLVRLWPDAGAKSVSVSFRGVVQAQAVNTSFNGLAEAPVPSTIPNPDSGWRWGMVAIDANGNARYSALQRTTRGDLSMCLMPGDQSVWLVVVGAPRNIQKVFWDQAYYSLYRFPWMAQFIGAQPDGHQPNASKPAGAPHPNGGGWVASGARVASTAYVGPYARVLGGSVQDKARIEDQATIYNGTISGNAVVGGLTRVTPEGIQIGGNAYVAITRPFSLDGSDKRVIDGTAALIGDIELNGDFNLNAGAYYGYVDAGRARDPQFGSTLTKPVTEVTIPGPYKWIP